MNDDALSKYLSNLLRRDVERLESNFFSSLGSTHSSQPDQPLTIEMIEEAIAKINPLPTRPFDEIQLSENGLKNLKTKLHAAGILADKSVTEPVHGYIEFVGIPIKIKAFIPSSRMLLVSHMGAIPTIFAIVDLGEME